MGDKKHSTALITFKFIYRKFPFDVRLCVKSSLFGENILVCPQQNFLYIIIIHSLTYVLKDSTWKMICTFYDSFWYTQLSFVLKCETFTLSLLRSFSFVLRKNLHNIASKTFCLKGHLIFYCDCLYLIKTKTV